MMRAAMLSALALVGCSQPAPPPAPAAAPVQQAAATGTPACNDLHLFEMIAAECRLEDSGLTLQVLFAAVPKGAESGTVTVNVLGDRGQVAQALVETGVPRYVLPTVQDVDGDGRADILIARFLGNVNIDWGVWIYNGERQRYERVGEISGVEAGPTDDGYISVSARSSCCSWEVSYYRLDEGGLHHLVTTRIENDEEPDGSGSSTCTISASPGLAELNLSERAAHERFCSSPSQASEP